MHKVEHVQRFTLLGAILLAPLGVASVAGADENEAYVPRPEHDLTTLTELIRRRSPVLQGDLLAADLARADARQARILGNPYLDATWGTIPLGDTTPSNLPSPLTSVPSYSVGLSYTFPLWKRGARIERADAIAEGLTHSAEATRLFQALGLARVIGRMAIDRMRLDGLRSFVGQQRAVLEIARTRLEQGFGTPLEIDRLEIELGRMSQQVMATEADEQAAIAACSTFAGMPCRGVGSSQDARALLEAWAKRATEGGSRVEMRPDILALDAFRRAANAEADLARAQAIPDPSLRVGYTHDQFTISGNQANSLSISLSLPLTIFDHGQALRDAAEARRARYEAHRTLLVGVSITRVAALHELLRLQQQRQDAIAKTLPRARAVVSDLERMANSRLIPFTDVFQARRTLDELLIEEADSYGDAFQTAVDLMAETGQGK